MPSFISYFWEGWPTREPSEHLCSKRRFCSSTPSLLCPEHWWEDHPKELILKNSHAKSFPSSCIFGVPRPTSIQVWVHIDEGFPADSLKLQQEKFVLSTAEGCSQDACTSRISQDDRVPTRVITRADSVIFPDCYCIILLLLLCYAFIDLTCIQMGGNRFVLE